MNERTMNLLARRLDRLERENRRLKRVGSAVLIGLAILALMGQATPARVQKLVEAERFVLRDTNGKLRATLSMEDGSPSLSLHDEVLRFRAVLGVAGGSPALELLDQAQTIRATLIALDGAPVLTLNDQAGKHRAMLSVADSGGSPALEFFDQAGKVIWKAP
jgi:hypothetical protein